MRSTHSPRYKGLLRRLREARRQAGLTQVEAARAIGRPQSFVSKCESGERRIDVVELLELSRVYGKTLGFFAAEIEGGKGAALSTERREAYRAKPARRRARRR
jgi:transcriptional regulator with XRE-family HTH domain